MGSVGKLTSDIEPKTENRKENFPNKLIDQNNLTDELIQEMIAGKDNYMLDPDYKKLEKESIEYYKKLEEYNKRIQELREELKPETTRKPESEWDVQDQLSALLGEKPVSYTDKGQSIKIELDQLESAKRGLSSILEATRDQIDEWDEREGGRSRNKTLTAKEREYYSTEVQDNYQGFKTAESTTSFIDNALKEGKAKLVEMSPKRYIQECATSIFKDSSIERVLVGRRAKDVAKYMTMMENGVKFDTPYLNYQKSGRGQEGLHRAIAAYMLGIEKIPVIILR